MWRTLASPTRVFDRILRTWGKKHSARNQPIELAYLAMHRVAREMDDEGDDLM